MSGEWIKKETNIVRVAISIVATILLVARIQWPKVNIDSVSIGFLVVAFLPWISSFIDKASLPGGWGISFREMKQTVENHDKQIQHQGEVIKEQRKIVDDLVIFSMAWFLFDLLKGIYYAQKHGEKYLFHKDKNNVDNLLFLRNNGYIELQGIRQLENNTDLAKIVKLTPIGSSYVEIREKRDRELRNKIKT